MDSSSTGVSVTDLPSSLSEAVNSTSEPVEELRRREMAVDSR